MIRPTMANGLVPAAGLVIASILLLPWLATGAAHAAKPVPTLTLSNATLVDPAPCRISVTVEWDDVHGPGVATLQLVGDPNATSISFRANAGGVTATLFPAEDGPFTQVRVVVERRNGRVLMDQLGAVSVSCLAA